jgi:hypothetical protein
MEASDLGRIESILPSIRFAPPSIDADLSADNLFRDLSSDDKF